ncbi:MAG: arsinothricin resistance N-acetyltransferase ArsN1 family B [Gemmatimonadaceae bacterium]|nr:arsinothricin resistance N-acetyltransferase ArsN1 family B [Gemmatimonadaceae bacterium]
MTPRTAAEIRHVLDTDTAALAAIYNHFVTDTIVTFEETPITGDEMLRRVQVVRAAMLPWLVAMVDGRVAGYAYASKWKERIGYRHSVESTVYLAPTIAGRGVGSALYDRLFATLAERGVHAVMGGIALPNDASVALHEKFGMRKVAHFTAVGYKFGAWIDVGYWQRILEPT